ncbi:hypothetical protein F4Z98_06135 [Candidatus Poribacteria bacterium]|nr:hypothetical protein [Candidatus Poribacteria bacterium]MYB01741.1 hypothetical protein [Candidatus Poribacteria bacterium]
MKYIIDFIEASDFFIDWLLSLCGLIAVALLIVLLYRFFVVLGLLQRIALGLIVKKDTLTETLRLVGRFCSRFIDDSDSE